MPESSLETSLEERTPKDVMVYRHNPNRKLFHIIMALKNMPGALASTATVLSKAQINISNSFTSVTDDGLLGIWSLFAETRKGGLDAESLRTLVTASPYAVEVEVREAADGFVMDRCFPLRWNEGGRALLMRQKYFSHTLDMLREQFGSGGDLIVYEEGLDYGTETWEDLARQKGKGFFLADLNDTLTIYTSVGWGRTACLEFNRKRPRVRVRVEENFECVDHRSDSPYSQFVRGHLAGGLSVLLGVSLACEEVSCLSRGDRYCEFVLNRQTSLAAMK